MVEYAVLVAHNTATFMSGIGGDFFSWASRLNGGTFVYAAAAVVMLGLALAAFRPTRRF
jgi:hypothetical protein